MAWAYFCWRGGGGFVTSTFPPTAGLAVGCGCRIFGGLPSAGQNDRGGFPRPRRCYGGLLTGECYNTGGMVHVGAECDCHGIPGLTVGRGDMVDMAEVVTAGGTPCK
ncbi:hypothetical protein NDU88_007345 [Pleurodeles waltl]|uniref:Uncharacterized protein n=1 Tax=Pleurodeles waltl TaxID=8319 RepID=A0AAV7QLJ2_PLEWA|nr:hypothetical protein NDU88_007345 [Pleurodeles waltl]